MKYLKVSPCEKVEKEFSIQLFLLILSLSTGLLFVGVLVGLHWLKQ